MIVLRKKVQEASKDTSTNLWPAKNALCFMAKASDFSGAEQHHLTYNDQSIFNRNAHLLGFNGSFTDALEVIALNRAPAQGDLFYFDHIDMCDPKLDPQDIMPGALSGKYSMKEVLDIIRKHFK